MVVKESQRTAQQNASGPCFGRRQHNGMIILWQQRQTPGQQMHNGVHMGHSLRHRFWLAQFPFQGLEAFGNAEFLSAFRTRTVKSGLLARACVRAMASYELAPVTRVRIQSSPWGLCPT